MAKTVRLTMSQAIATFLANQMTEIDVRKLPIFGGIWAIFGHGNVAGMGEELYQVRHRLPVQRPLPLGQRAIGPHFGFVGQVRDHAFVGLQPPQQVRLHQGPQRRIPATVRRFHRLDRAPERLRRAQQARVYKIKQRP